MTRQLVFIVPLIVIAIFWAMSHYEARFAGADSQSRSFFQRNGAPLSIFFLAAVAFWTLLLIALPYLYMVQESFHPKLPFNERGGPDDVLTIQNYRSFIYDAQGFGWNWTHLSAFFWSIVTSLLVTVVNFIIAYPMAFYLAQVGSPQKVRVIMLALIVPYWVNEILRAFALRVILATGGLINKAFLAFGLISTPFDFLGNNVGLYVGLSYAYLLVMIFPLYNAIESLDKNQIEAARDLGAPWWKIHRDVVIPYAKPGIAAGCTIVFMLCAGSLAAPQFLGGPRTLWFTAIVYDFFFQAFNWPRGAAYAFILLIACIFFVMVMLRVFKVSLGETIK
ncbi:ABC transporter permease subunit [soil metagenome]